MSSVNVVAPAARRRLAGALLPCLIATLMFAQSVIMNSPGKKGTVAIRNATIVPVASAPIPNGTIVFSNGLITAVGASVTIPANATVIDGTGLFVYPGLIDAARTSGWRRSAPYRVPSTPWSWATSTRMRVPRLRSIRTAT